MVTEPRLLGERYQIGALLGYGGMAEVHRAMDTRLGRDVAIKTLRVDLARDPGFQARFRREAQSAASLNHPAIVAVYDTGDEVRGREHIPYIVMEYVEGRTLRDLLNVERRLPWAQALAITAKICQALDYSHRQGIVHRDIKPANVMLTPGDEVKVMDFGIARAVTASSATMTQTAAVMGTAQYLSPEQARGDPVDPRSDVYSTGCLLYELVTGTPPFTGDSPVAVAYQHVREDPVPPSQVVAGVPAPVDAIILKAMAKNPANRYQSGAEMRQDCERALAGAPVAATPLLEAPTVALGAGLASGTILPPEDGPRSSRRGLGYVLLALACIAVLIGAALLTRYLIGNSRQVSVPDLINDTVAAAQAELSGQGLSLGSQTQGASTAKVGTIIAQDPPANTRVGRDSSVDVTVSVGPGTVVVPDVTDSTTDEATATLRARGLTVGRVSDKASSKPAGTVLTQDPAAGTKVRSGTAVTLTVASGTGRVPSVIGLKEAAARTALNKAGFQVNSQQRASATGSPGAVITQDPPAGSSQDIGSTVLITVAIAPPPTPTPTPTPTTSSPTPTPTPTSPTPTPTLTTSTPTVSVTSPTATTTATNTNTPTTSTPTPP